MATTKEIEEIFGLPSSKIDSWARTRDSNFLLVQFLKSFSHYDLETRLDNTLSRIGYERKSTKEFIDVLVQKLTSCGILELEHFSQEQIVHIMKDDFKMEAIEYTPDFTISIDGKIYIFDFKKLLPSKRNLLNGVERIQEKAKRDGLEIGHIFYIVNNKTIPHFIVNDTEISKRASIYRFDDIAIRLFGTKIIIAGSM